MTTLLLPALALAAPVPNVTIDQDRVLLSHLVEDAPSALSSFDFGPAPAPGQSRIWSQPEIERRLRQAYVDHRALQIPTQVRVTRSLQVLSEPELQSLASRSLAALLPESTTLRKVSIQGGARLPKGNVHLEWDLPRQWQKGRQTVSGRIQAGTAQPSPIVVTVEVERIVGQTVVARGAQILVVARAPGVRVQTLAVAQEAGAVGDTIAVLPDAGRKVIRARILDQSTVEVNL